MFERFGRLLKFSGAEMLPARDAYALWADSYPPRPHNPLMEAEQSVLAPTLVGISHALARDHPRTRRALDIGTGTGRYLPLVAPAGMKLTAGLDLSMPMLAAPDLRLLAHLRRCLHAAFCRRELRRRVFVADGR